MFLNESTTDRIGIVMTWLMAGNSLSDWLASVPIGTVKGAAEAFAYLCVGVYWISRIIRERRKQ